MGPRLECVDITSALEVYNFVVVVIKEGNCAPLQTILIEYIDVYQFIINYYYYVYEHDTTVY